MEQKNDSKNNGNNSKNNTNNSKNDANNSKNDKKKSSKNIKKKIIIIKSLIPLLLILLAAVIIFALIDGLLGLLKDLLIAILKFLQEPWKFLRQLWAKFTNYLSSVFDASSFNPDEYLTQRANPVIVVTDEQFNEMKTQLNSIIDRNVAGLDDIMLKKLLLAYFRGIYLKDTTILIEIPHEDIGIEELKDTDGDGKKERDENPTTPESCFEYDTWYTDPEGETQHAFILTTNGKNKVKEYSNLTKPFALIEGMPEGVILDNGVETFKAGGTVTFTKDDGNVKTILGEEATIYMMARGQVDITTDTIGDYGEKLQYWPKDVLEEIYNTEYIERLERGKYEYAKQIEEYLKICYTYYEPEEETPEGAISFSQSTPHLQMYTQRETTNPLVRTWTYKNEKDATIYDNERYIGEQTESPITLQTIEYCSKILEYGTPLEFLVSLLEISASKEFVEKFIEATETDNYMKLKLYETTNSTANSIETTRTRKTIVSGKKTGYTAKKVKTLNPDGSVNNSTQEDWTQYITINDGQVTVKRNDITSNLQYQVDLYYCGSLVKTGTLTKTNKSFTYYNDWAATWDFVDISDIRESEKEETIETKYAVGITKIKTWYGESSVVNNKNTTLTAEVLKSDGTKETVQVEYNPSSIDVEPKTLAQLEAELSGKIQEVGSPMSQPNETWKWDFKNGITYKNGSSVAEGYNMATISAKKNINQIEYEADGKKEIIYEKDAEGNYKKDEEGNVLPGKITGYTMSECLNVPFVYAINTIGSPYWGLYEFDTMEGQDSNITKRETTITRKISVSQLNPMFTIPDTSIFVGLLKEPDGTKKTYKDLYGDENAVVGGLFENAEDMLYELLGTYDNTKSLVPVMKILMYNYLNNIAKVFTWEFGLIDEEGFVTIEDFETREEITIN